MGLHNKCFQGFVTCVSSETSAQIIIGNIFISDGPLALFYVKQFAKIIGKLGSLVYLLSSNAKSVLKV